MTDVTMGLPFGEQIGQRLRRLREARGIRREQVALALDMGAENWRHYEKGRTALTVPMLPTIAETYGMRLEELLSELFDLPLGATNGAQGVVTGEHERSPKHSDEYGSSLALYLDKPRWHGLRSGHARKRELVGAGAC